MKTHPSLHRLPSVLQSVPVAFPPVPRCPTPDTNALAASYNVSPGAYPVLAGTSLGFAIEDFVFFAGTVAPCCANGSYVLSAASPQGVLDIVLLETAPGSNTYNMGIQTAAQIDEPMSQAVVLNYTDCEGNARTLNTTINFV